MGNKVTIIVVFSTILVLFFGMTLFDDTQAVKSQGNSLTETNSQQVCGTSLCDEPMSIEEKIRLYLQKLSGGESTVLQQAIDPRLMKEPLKVKPGTMSQPVQISPKISMPKVMQKTEPDKMTAKTIDPFLAEMENPPVNLQEFEPTTNTDFLQFDSSKNYLSIFFNSNEMVESGTTAYLAGNRLLPNSYNNIHLGIDGTIVFMVADSFTGVRDVPVTYTIMVNKGETMMSCTNYNEEGGPGYCSTKQNPVRLLPSDQIGIKIEVEPDPRPGYTLGSTPQILLIFQTGG